MIDRVPADCADDVFNLAVVQRQAIALLGDQTHDVTMATTVPAPDASLTPQGYTYVPRG